MKKIVFSKDVKISIVLALFGLLAGIAVTMWQLGDPSLSKAIPNNISKEALIAISAFQVMIMTLILSIIGINFFWKKGFAMAIASHITAHLFRLLIFMPLFF